MYNNPNDSWNNLLSRIFEPLCMIAFLSSIIYIYIYAYTVGFCGRLNIPFRGLNLPTTFYIGAIYSCIFGIFLIILITISIYLIYRYIVTPACKYCCKAPDKCKEFYSKLCNLTCIDRFCNISHSKKFCIFFLIVYIILAYISFQSATIMGINSAEKLINGELSQSIEIYFNLKNPIQCIENKKLILIMYHDRNYYVTEKNKTPPMNPIVFIIPDSQVNSVILYRSQLEFVPNPCDYCIPLQNRTKSP